MSGPEPRLPRVVRPYVLTGGRTRTPGRILPLDATVVTTASADTRPVPDTPEMLRILELGSTPTAIAELAGRLTLPVGVVRVLVSDLDAIGAITVTPPPSFDVPHDVELLERLLDGIRAL